MIAAIRISGLPYVWHTGDAPTSWGTISGETYTLVDTLDPTEITGPEEQIEPWAGICLPGQIRLRLVCDSTWLGLLNRSIYRGAVSALTTAVQAADPAISVDDSTGLEPVLYLGTETMAASITSGTTLDVTRGRYGSTDDPHGSGALVSDHPLVLRGRTVWLYVGEEHEAITDCLVDTGVLESVQLTEDLAWVELCAGDLLRLVDGQAAEGVESGTAEHGELIQVDEWSSQCSITTRQIVITIGSPTSATTFGGRLPGTAPLRTREEVCAAIAEAIGFGKWALSTVWIDGARHWKIACTTTWGYGIILDSSEQSIWRELGFDPGSDLPVTLSLTTGLWTYSLAAQRPRALCRIPAGRGLRTVWTSGFDDGGETTTDAACNPLPVVFKVGEEWWEGALVRTIASNGQAYTGIAPRNRALFGTVDTTREETYSADGDEPIEVTRLVAYVRCEWPRVVGYLLCGGRPASTFGTRLTGVGLAIPESLVDVAGLEALALVGDGAEQISVVLEEGRSVREVIEPILVQHGYYLHTSGGKLTVESVRQVLATDATAAVTLDHDDIASVQGIRWDLAEDNIVNRVIGTDLGKTERRASASLGYSVATWGATEPGEVSLDYYLSREEAEQALVQMAGRLTAQWGVPYCVAEVEVASDLAWTLQLGDAVALTHDALPSVSAVVGRGVTDLGAVVYGRAPVYSGGESRGRLTLLISGLDGATVTEWAPSARGTALTPGVGSCVITIDVDYYSDDDLAEYEAGDEVRVYERGDEASAVTCTVTSVGAASLTVDSTLAALSAPVIVEWATYASATARQQAYAYVGDDTAGRPYTIDGSADAQHME